jgi:hypothetical protein
MDVEVSDIILQEPANAQQIFSAQRSPWSFRQFQSFSSSNNPGRTCPRSPSLQMEPALDNGLENLQKWYHKVDDTDVYFICLGTLSFYLSYH